jgi:hypothetical protein
MALYFQYSKSTKCIELMSGSVSRSLVKSLSQKALFIKLKGPRDGFEDC